MFLLRMIPKKYWLYIGLVLGSVFIYYKHIDYIYQKGVSDTKARYEQSSKEALDKDLKALNSHLTEAIASREKARQEAIQKELEVSTYRDKQEWYKNEIKRLSKVDRDCKSLDDGDFRVLQQILSQKL